MKHYGEAPAVLDPFSGRGMIPLESARAGARAFGIDYSPMATLASQLLAEYPLRDWSGEPDLPFDGGAQPGFDRLADDVRAVLDEVTRRYEKSVAEFYPQHDGQAPWGYLWAVTLPCQECGGRFPLTGSLVLRHPLPKKGDPGQSYRIEVDRAAGTFRAIVHDGPPTGQPTLAATMRAGKTVKGKSAVCPFCEHSHPKDTHQRLAAERLGEDALLVAADLDAAVGKSYREPTAEELLAVQKAEEALAAEPNFGPGLPAVPDEAIPESNGATIRPQLYGARTYGDLSNRHQTLSFVRLARVINDLGQELLGHGFSQDYAAALMGYASAVMIRKYKRATRAPLSTPTSALTATA